MKAIFLGITWIPQFFLIPLPVLGYVKCPGCGGNVYFMGIHLGNYMGAIQYHHGHAKARTGEPGKAPQPSNVLMVAPGLEEMKVIYRQLPVGHLQEMKRHVSDRLKIIDEVITEKQQPK